MMLVYCKSESDSTTYDFFMKYIPENISCTLEALAYISLFESQIAYRCGDFNWEDKKLQNFLGSNHITLADKPENSIADNMIYFTHTDNDIAYDFLKHIRDALLHGFITDSGCFYNLYNCEDVKPYEKQSAITRFVKSFSSKKSDETPKILMKGNVRKDLFWRLIITAIKTNKFFDK